VVARLWSRTQNEREGKGVRLRAQVSEGGGRAGREAQKRRGRADVTRERVEVGASMVGNSGREVWDSSQVGSAGQRGKRARGREKRHRQAWPMGQQEREGERERTGVGVDRRCPPIRHRGRAGASARVGLGRLGLNGPKWLFLFPGNF
jgi:hypothetical protein